MFIIMLEEKSSVSFEYIVNKIKDVLLEILVWMCIYFVFWYNVGCYWGYMNFEILMLFLLVYNFVMLWNGNNVVYEFFFVIS